MLPCFEGLDHWLPRFVRQELIQLMEGGLIKVAQVVLRDAEIPDPDVRSHVNQRWNERSPLRRAAYAALADLEGRGKNIHAVYLHGVDVDEQVTPYYVGFNIRHLDAAVYCLQEHGGVEWIEVVHPTRRGPLRALRIEPADAAKLAEYRSPPGAYFC